MTEAAAPVSSAIVSPARRPTHTRLLAATTVALALVLVAPLGLDYYTVNILSRALLYAILALTLDLLWGYTGILSYGQSAFFAIGAYALGLTSTHVGFDPALVVLAFVGGALVAAFVGWLTGWIAFGRGVPILYVSVVTLVLPIVVKQLLLSGGTYTGSSSGLSGFRSFDLDLETWFRIAGCALVVLTALAWLLVKSDAGRVLIAIRENEIRCQYLGIPTAAVKTTLMVVSAIVAAGAGFCYAANTMVVAPELGGFEFGTEILIWVALGGRGTLFGPVIGALVINLVSAHLGGSIPYVWKLIVGLAFVGVIVLLPRGFTPIFERAGHWIVRFVPALKRARKPHFVPTLAAARASASGVTRRDVPSLEIKGLRRRFGSLTVLDGVDLVAHGAELVSIIGPNGAGKTTMMRCIADGAERSGGSVAINGNDIGRHPPERCVRFGLGRKFQNATIFETPTVAECLRIARATRVLPSFQHRLPVLELPQAALDVVVATGLDQVLGVEARNLSHGQKQALELAMVLALEPNVLLLDEPTAGLTKAERNVIGGILTALVTQHRLCIILVEHDLDFVREISSRVVVLHQGRVLLDGTVAEVVESELVRNVYSGAHA